jgi:hypothetical protein
MVYANNDIKVLKSLLRGAAPTVSSAHRVRLEMLGLIVDGTEGLRITPKGEFAAGTTPFRPETIFTTARERLEAVRRGRAPKKDRSRDAQDGREGR